MMAMMEQYLPIILQSEVVDERTAESYAYLDVAGTTTPSRATRWTTSCTRTA